MKIRQLIIATPRLEAQKAFYTRVIGLAVGQEADGSASFSIGNSVLTIREEEGATPYHFAFNIPAYDEEKALNWLKGRVGILTDQGKEIQDFSSWNARSVYFYDADKNIVEFIARRNLQNASAKPFSPGSLLEISEIGLAVNQIPPIYKLLKQLTGLTIFDGNLANFCAIGDDHGLLICVNFNRKSWYPTGDTAFPSPFEMQMEAHGREFKLHYTGEELKVEMQIE